jgi:adenine-specific DNA-methyltransferase
LEFRQVAKAAKGRRVPVDAVVHKKAKRTNIPTAELGSFIAKDEAAPKKILYPRDPSLDPQLVWKGKDEQDRGPLEVPAAPIYIQEKISPQALIENLKTEQRKNDDQPELFAEFNGLEFDKLVDFYKHSQSWTNRLILGDSLLVMTSLAEKEGLKGKVQMIYVDPPYGIKFGSNWQVSTRTREVSDGKAEDVSRQPEQIRAFRDTWQLGIHSYLAYLRDRFVVSRELLTETGSIFVQIGDSNVHLVRCLLDEVFGPENFCSLITFKKTTSATGELLPGTVDYLVWYARDKVRVKYRPLYREKAIGAEGSSAYTYVQVADGLRRPMTLEERRDPTRLPAKSRPYRRDNLTSQSVGREKGEGAASWFAVDFDGHTFRPSLQTRWKTNREGMRRLELAGRLAWYGTTLAYVRFIDDFPAFPLTNTWEDTTIGYGETKEYVVQTSTRVIERCVLLTSDPGDLVLDPTCGSGTTAFIAEQWGRRWITVDTSRVALALSRMRLMAAKYPYYILSDSPEGTRLAPEVGRQVAPEPRQAFEGDVRKGFVYKTVRHVKLGTIANNPEIRDGMSRAEIEAVIARGSEIEKLYDQPSVDSSTVRVSGPFTVESLSPHRAIETVTELAAGVQDATAGGGFEQVVMDNLKAAGVQNTVKGERLQFDTLEPWSGVYIQGVGEYSENGVTKRAAICIGPEHGTVGVELVREAAKEAARFFDILLVCGFAFEARVGEETRQLGKLTVLKAAMNPDLAMGGDLLKKTGSANLFMVFGEPDIEIRQLPDDKIEVEIRGLDVYDPTTGEIRSHSTTDIACWFVDTDYNEESFFVRHAYFLGAGDPYEQLKRALRADIDEVVWSSLYSTVSRPFPRPNTGKIALKVINHYGDEVMKVYSVGDRSAL